MVDAKSKKIFVILSIAIGLSVAFTFYNTIVMKRFEIFISEDDIPPYKNFIVNIMELTNDYVR